MATTKRSKGGRAAAARGRGRAVKKATPKTPAARAKAAKSKAAATPKPKAAAKPKAAVKPKAVAKPRAVAKPKVGAPPKRPAAKPAAAPKAVAAKGAPGGEHPEIAALKSKFQRERTGLERRLTEAVREIGMLRHHELRVMQLERQLAERDATILQLQQQLAAGERRSGGETIVYVHEVQQSLALGMPASEELGPQDAGDELVTAALDEFEEQQLVDDADLVSDDEQDLVADDGDLLSDD